MPGERRISSTHRGTPAVPADLPQHRVVTHTANGAVPAYLIELVSVRIGTVEVRDVSAIVIPGQMSHVLLGNSFLNRFQMRRENDVMTLELRY